MARATGGAFVGSPIGFVTFAENEKALLGGRAIPVVLGTVLVRLSRTLRTKNARGWRPRGGRPEKGRVAVSEAPSAEELRDGEATSWAKPRSGS